MNISNEQEEICFGYLDIMVKRIRENVCNNW